MKRISRKGFLRVTAATAMGAATAGALSACINGKETPRISGEQALAALRVIWEVQDSLNFSAGLQMAAE